MDGNAINRRLMKMHDQAELVYKTPNPFADDGRDFFFFSDPPHLLRNCWKERWLWVCIAYEMYIVLDILYVLCNYVVQWKRDVVEPSHRPV